MCGLSLEDNMAPILLGLLKGVLASAMEGMMKGGDNKSSGPAPVAPVAPLAAPAKVPDSLAQYTQQQYPKQPAQTMAFPSQGPMPQTFAQEMNSITPKDNTMVADLGRKPTFGQIVEPYTKAIGTKLKSGPFDQNDWRGTLGNELWGGTLGKLF